MNNQELVSQEPNEKETKTRKRKLLTDTGSLWAKCQVCKEPGNLENMIYQKIAFKDQDGVELYGCFERVYFCSENCRELFSLNV